MSSNAYVAVVGGVSIREGRRGGMGGVVCFLVETSTVGAVSVGFD